MNTQGKKTRMYDPWGYQEQDGYQSGENLFLNELDTFFASVEYHDDDNKIHFYNNDGEEKATLDVSGFTSSVIEDVYYDSDTKILTIVFDNGEKVEINLGELIVDKTFGAGLQVNDDVVSIKIDNSSEPYITVSDNGLKLSGVTSTINTEKNRAISAETLLSNSISALTYELRPLINDTLVTTNEQEVALGKYNISRSGASASDNTVFTVGRGTSNENRKNLFEIRENGDVYMWIEGEYINVNSLLSVLTNIIYDNNES